MATFPKGKSGNLAGRPKGSGSSPGVLLRRSIERIAPDLIEHLRRAAHEGDVAATIALLDRALPKLRPEPATVQVDLSGDAQVVRQRILDAVAHGDMAIQTANELIALLKLDAATSTNDPSTTDELDAIYSRAMETAQADRDRLAGRGNAAIN